MQRTKFSNTKKAILIIYVLLCFSVCPNPFADIKADALVANRIYVALDDNTRVYREQDGQFAFFLPSGNHFVFEEIFFGTIQYTRIKINGSRYFILTKDNDLNDATRFSVAATAPELLKITMLKDATIREAPSINARSLEVTPSNNIQVVALGIVVTTAPDLGVDTEDLPLWYYINTPASLGISGYVNQRFIDGFQKSEPKEPSPTFPGVPENISQLLIILAICIPAIIIVFLIFRPSKKYSRSPHRGRRPYYDDYNFPDEDDDIYY